MADTITTTTTAPEPITIDPKPVPDNPNTESDPSLPLPSSSSSSTPPPPPNPNINTSITPPTIQPYGAAPPSFRPAPPVPSAAPPQFSPAYSVPGVLPPGVGGAPPGMMPPPPAPGAPQQQVVSGSPMMMQYAPPGQPMRPYGQPLMMPNAYPGMPQAVPQGVLPPPGMLRYNPYMQVVRPPFPPRPPGAVGIPPPLSRPPVPGLRAPVVPLIVRPPVISIVPTEKPQTTVYVGKISSTVENDFILSLLQLCGPVKSWKRPQDPSKGTYKGFGFCEFESAEGVLRAQRLLSKLNIDGQELMLTVNQATKEYLERYVEKKVESIKNQQETETEGKQAVKEEVSELGAEKNESSELSTESSKVSLEEPKKGDGDMQNKENYEPATFGLVTDQDRDADQEALNKLTSMMEERLKNNPLPPPPPPPPQTLADASAISNSELEKEGNSVADVVKKEEKNEDELTSDRKPSSEHERTETSSPDRSRRDDKRGRDRERDLKREKERELERNEKEREQDRAKREKEREYKIRDDERRFKVREKDWELREREQEHWRKREREREKERAQERKWEIIDQERESDDGYSKKRKYRGNDEDRKRRLREKEEDLADKLREEEEIAEARRVEEEQHKKQQLEALKILSRHAPNGSDKSITPEEKYIASKDKAIDQTSDHDSVHGDSNGKSSGGEEIIENGTADDSETHQNSNAPTKKLGFGLTGSGKRTAVPSVFNADEEEDARKEKKMRPLVPLDYTTEEPEAVQPPFSETPSSNLVAAAEFAKRLSNVNAKEERPDADRERSRRHQDRSSQRDRGRHHGEGGKSTRDESTKESLDRDKVRDHGPDKGNALESKKLFDAKQLIDMIPKTKDELFSYEINWNIYEENNLHERMKPWIAKKITEFLGEEEPTLVDYIMSTTHEHVKASKMLENLTAILDEEAEMFVLKMWRMLIFEIKKVESGLASRPKS